MKPTKSFRQSFYSAIALLVCLPNMAGLFAQDWPAFRGADGLGTANPGGILAKSKNVDLKIRWKKELGSGYSSVVVVGDRVITCFCNTDGDYVVCLDKKTGDQHWLADLGPFFKGENGSYDGPITTPLIHDGLVYALDPGGRFVCLQLTDGKEVWSKHMVEDFGSVKPLYGFATSSIIVGDTLILQTGTKDKSLAGLDPKTGEIKWAVSNDAIESQTPLVTKFHGRDIVLAAGRKLLVGVNPADGTVLFEFEHQGANGGALVPVPIGDDRFVLTLDDMHAKAVKLRPGNEDKIEASEAWQNRSIKNTYNVPALSGGNLFAYSTRILTCVDPQTGDAHWKSRDPGDGFLITIDGHMIINTKQGTLHVARANREEYQEVAYLELFDDNCWSVPAYSDNAIFCRNLKEIACVDIVATETSAGLAAVDDELTGPTFGAFIQNVRQASDANDAKKKVDEYLASQDSFPIIEDGIAHFVYRGPGTGIAVASDIFGSRQERKMKRLNETDFYYHTVRLEPDQRANYMFLVDYQPQPDPLNPRMITSSVYKGEMEFAVRLRKAEPLEMSWFGMADWKEPEYLKNLDGDLAGSLSQDKIESENVESDFGFEIYLPPGYDQDTETRYRTVYIFAVPGGREHGQLDKSVDRIFQDGSFQDESSGVDPAILVFVNFPVTPDVMGPFKDEFIPAIDAKYRTKADRESRTAVGFGFAGASAIILAINHADTFSGVSAYSPLVFAAEQAALDAAFESLTEPMHFYIEWGRFDMFNPDENWDIRSVAKQFFERCQEKEGVTVSGGMVNDSTDWSSWRNRYLEFLKVGNE